MEDQRYSQNLTFIRIQERLNDVELPYGATPGLDPLTSPTGEIYRYIMKVKIMIYEN